MVKIMLFLKKLALPIIVALSILFYKVFPKVQQDNPVEEIVEQIIVIGTGQDIDLSPMTPEFIYADNVQEAPEFIYTDNAQETLE